MPNIQAVSAQINGQIYNLTLNSSTGKYEAVITAPSKSSYTINSGHYYDVAVTATDNAGNSTMVDASDATLGASLKLVVKEKVSPIITIQSPTAGATLTNNKPTIKIGVTDEDSGIDINTLSVSIDGEGSIELNRGTLDSPDDRTSNWEYTPDTALTDGPHTITVNVSDNDGNAAVQKSVTFKVDTTPPVLNVSAPSDGLYTNKTVGTVAGTTNDATSSPVTVTISANGADQGAVTVAGDGAFSHNITYVEGDNTIVIRATDAAGKYSEVERIVHVNTVAPKIKNVTITPNPVNAGSTYTITVEVE